MKERTVLINCSPKRRLSVSGFLMTCASLLIRGEKERYSLRNASDHQAILDAIRSADKVVFVMPLYVDSVPSHVLPFLRKMEALCQKEQLRLKIYVIANNGFIEGRQNEPLMRLMENFCARSGLTWCGGIGIGGGVMLNVERIMIAVLFGLTILNTIMQAAEGKDILEPISSFAVSVAELLVLTCGIITYLVRLVWHVNRGTQAGKRYTRIMLPSFVFILFADIFFTIISALQGGLFRGWFARPQPDEKCDLIMTRDL